MGPFGGAEKIVDRGVQEAVVYMGLVARSLEKRAVEDDMEEGALFVAALAYNVERLEVLEAASVLSCKGMTDSHAQGGAKGGAGRG